jgi:hypothetical protein
MNESVRINTRYLIIKRHEQVLIRIPYLAYCVCKHRMSGSLLNTAPAIATAVAWWESEAREPEPSAMRKVTWSYASSTLPSHCPHTTYVPWKYTHA